MAQAKVVREPITPVSHDLDKAYELGKLSGEVRILKWGVGVALVAMLGSMGVLYEGIDDVRADRDSQGHIRLPGRHGRHSKGRGHG